MELERMISGGEVNGVVVGCIVACVTAAVAVGIALWYRHREKQTLRQLEKMLDAAINGTFTEKNFDESVYSAVEAKFAKYLSLSTVSAKQVEKEKEEIKEMISDLSHQTKTPLTTLLLYTELLEELELSPEGRAYLTMLKGQTKRLEFLVESFVKTSRLETGVFRFHRKENEVLPMLRKTAAMYEKRAAEKRITLSVEPNDANPKAVFDTKWTEEAVGNLLDNALKYTPEGGKVTVRAVPYEMFCRIDVTDTGIGIPEEERNKVFGRFYRSEAVAETEGVGIGLYLVRQIATGQGGYVKITEGEAGGTAVSLFLSRSET